jgi:monooxygenase
VTTTTDTDHLDVLIIGAGLSGVGAARYLQDKCPWADFAILEARDAIGGTWDLFRYPGIRSDSDMFTLGYSFRPWDGEKTIADGESILQYIKDTASETKIDDHIRFRHRVTSLNWSTAEGRWLATAERTDTGEVIELTCGFVFACSGYYRYDHGYQPEFAGMDQFKGQVIHPQAWPSDFDASGKRIVVIGSGATAVTLVPSLATEAAHVTMLQRSPTYIASVASASPLPGMLKRVLPEKRAGAITRWILALGTQAFYQVSQRRPKIVKRLLLRGVKKQLPDGYDVATHFTPNYNPWDQRLCAVPDGDLFKSIRNGSASVVTDHIDTFTETGLRLSSGAELPADIIVTATGLELLFLGGAELQVDGSPVDLPSRLMYKGMMIEGVPNLAVAIGYTNASWTLKCDLTCDYVCRLLNYMHDHNWQACEPQNAGFSSPSGPMLGLSSGYIQRSAHLLPRQGSEFPWQVHQSYLRDYRALKVSDLDDSFMKFSNPKADHPVAVAAELQRSAT